ncbi:MAG: hypothetical protein GEU92_01645 [Alphaproteobacteria bacterium]|nr:hypothetical protein [Alphaproteobacteria bacterium]
MADGDRRGVLITRPAADAGPLADAVATRGLDPVLAPLLEIRETGDTVTLDGVQSVLLTSANGARALAGATPRRDVPVLAVGDATAAAARAAGFAHVQGAGGDVAALAGLVRDICDAGAGALLHVSGHDVAGDLAGMLAGYGFIVNRAVLYRAEPAAALPENARAALAAGHVGAALFFSPRTAQSFVKLAEQAGVGGACREVAALCLSDAVAEALRAPGWSEIRVADRPDLDALLACLDAWAAAPNPEYRVTEKPEDESTPWTEAGGETPLPKSDPATRPAAAKSSTSAATGAGAAKPSASVSAATGAGKARPAASGGGLGRALIGFLLVLVLAGGAYIAWPLYGGSLPGWLRDGLAPVMQAGRGAAPATADGATTERLAAIETALADIRRQMAGRPETAGNDARMAALAREIERLTGQIGALRDAQAPLAQRLEEQQGTDLAARLSALEGRIDALAAAPQNADAPSAEALAALREQAERRNADLENRNRSLEAALARLGERLQAVEARAGSNAGSAEGAALLVAAGELRAAVRAGRGYAAALESARAVAPDSPAMKAALATLAAHAEKGVAGIDDLRDRFGPMAREAAQAGLAPEGAGWVDQTLSRLSRLVTVRRVGEDAAAEDTVTGRLARAELRLAAGDLPGAVAAIKGLEGKPAAAATGWLADARAHLKAEEALATANAEAIRVLGGGAGKGAAGG